jgi:hypothetical protein
VNVRSHSKYENFFLSKAQRQHQMAVLVSTG